MYSKEQVDQIRTLYLEGKSVKEITGIVKDIPYQSVWGIATHRTHPDEHYKNSLRYRPPRKRVINANIKYLIELRNRGFIYKKIAEVASIKLGHKISHAAVFQAIKRTLEKEQQ